MRVIFIYIIALAFASQLSYAEYQCYFGPTKKPQEATIKVVEGYGQALSLTMLDIRFCLTRQSGVDDTPVCKEFSGIANVEVHKSYKTYSLHLSSEVFSFTIDKNDINRSNQKVRCELRGINFKPSSRLARPVDIPCKYTSSTPYSRGKC